MHAADQQVRTDDRQTDIDEGQPSVAVGRAAVPQPRPRHPEANVGRAGNLTPGQRYRTVCNDPFKNHMHRRRGGR
ncbi:hypothetical protein ACWT_7136 [Actinoplanes sp. SE50]|nr:hypothetical protein ACPL_7266 [Actinoplanes sp. SE50/110]ATO86551.1 hypothetical protein ACWT_7136 [Actinoplanes sp. SE50]SLM03968.1 hypothetical protein ACSP50_7267 [Actinoplanes sp. SE50/110]